MWSARRIASLPLLLTIAVGGCGDASEDQLSGVESSDGQVIDQVTTSVATSIEGRWALESWEENGEPIEVEVGVNTVSEPWIEFTQTFDGVRDSFASADGTGTAGTFVGSTGCNGIRETTYEFSAAFLKIDEAVVQAVGCSPDEAERVLLAMLWNTSDGIEVVMGGDRMEWLGSNLGGIVYPLVFRRDGSRPSEPGGVSSSTSPLAAEAPAIRVYEVVGVEVVTPTYLEQLPERAAIVEFATTVIDSGGGPELCIGGVGLSLPPQCAGPVVADLDMAGWSEELNGVRWGERTVLVTWPPVDGVVALVGQSEAVIWDAEYPAGELPAECADSRAAAGAGAINEYAHSLGDSNGGLYIANDGTLVLQVVGDPAPHRKAMAEFGGACVISVARSEAEQRSIQDAIVPLLANVPELAGIYAASLGPGGRLVVQVPVADRRTAEAIASLVEDPTAIRIVGTGILHP